MHFFAENYSSTPILIALLTIVDILYIGCSRNQNTINERKTIKNEEEKVEQRTEIKFSNERSNKNISFNFYQ